MTLAELKLTFAALSMADSELTTPFDRPAFRVIVWFSLSPALGPPSDRLSCEAGVTTEGVSFDEAQWVGWGFDGEVKQPFTPSNAFRSLVGRASKIAWMSFLY